MNKSVAAVIAIASLTVGCFLPAKEPTLTMHADVSFNEIERNCIDSSAEQWRYQTNGLADIRVKYDYDSHDPVSVLEHVTKHRIVKWSSSHPQLVEFEAELNEDLEPGEPVRFILGQVGTKNGIHNAFRLPVEMRLVSDRFYSGQLCRNVTIHEFGHVLGVPHITSSEKNIMFPVALADRKPCLKEDDLLAFCYFNDCGNVKMEACED